MEKALKETQSSQYIKSPLNYIGGKYKLLGQIMPLFPKQIRTFVDLFSGGANVGINVSAKHHVFNDMNSRINEMFRLFQTIPVEQLIADIHDRIDTWQLSKTNEDAFLAFRRHYNEAPDPLDLYILSSYSYNYQFRFNSRLEFNNPFGRNRSYFSPSMERHLREFCERLGVLDATFTDLFFEDFDYERLGSDDFVYLDPPYLITTGSYNDGGRGFRDWNATSEKTLFCVLQKLSDLGVSYALSNVLEHKGRTNTLLAQFIEDNDVLVTDLNYNYDNPSYNSKTRGSREVLVTNYPALDGKNRR